MSAGGDMILAYVFSSFDYFCSLKKEEQELHEDRQQRSDIVESKLKGETCGPPAVDGRYFYLF